MIKRSLKLLVVIIFALVLLPINVQAKTLGELKREFNELEEKYNSTTESIEYTEAEIAEAKEKIESIYGEIEAAEKEIQDITGEIAKLNESIVQKDKEIKELIKFFQVSQGESTYLEYIFSASSITDFIHRVSVTEQLSKYNDRLIDEMNTMIVENNKNIDNLHAKEESLKGLQEELSEKVRVLSSQRESLHDESASLLEEIASARQILDTYTALGCTDDDDIFTCANSELPFGTKFWRPIKVAAVTDEYGWRICPFHGPEIHSGIDMSGYDYTVYAISDGKVKYTGYNGSMGNYIVIDHNINGENYSSVYMHIDWGGTFVSEGDIVNKDTVIARMGTTGSSTGDHLHLSIYKGLYGRGGYLVNPRDYINFPSTMYRYWYDRTTYYN